MPRVVQETQECPANPRGWRVRRRVGGLTYIRLHRGLEFLAVILDAFSRKVFGWKLGRTLAARLPIAALELAIAERTSE